jgi:TolB-like protein
LGELFTEELSAQALDIPLVARKLDVQIVFEGTVREDNNQLRITSRVVNAADGFHIWSERLEIEPDTQSLFEISERLTSALLRSSLYMHFERYSIRFE